MSRTTTNQYDRLDLDTLVGPTDKQILALEGDKFSIRIPTNVSYGSTPFNQLIHFTVTLKIEEQ